MKRKPLIDEIVKIIIDCAILPLYFIKFYHDVAVLPGFDAEGNRIVSEIDHYYSIFYKLDREGLAALFWIAFTLTVASIIVSVLRIFIKDNKSLKIASYAVFTLSAVLFLAVLFISLQIDYKY